MRKAFLYILTLVFTSTVSAQQIPDWQNKDLKTDSLFGISTHKAYELLKGKKSTPIIVAVIDAGVDTSHEDLKNSLWVNPKKQKGDSGTYGWSYIGSANGNVQYDNLELTRQVRQHQQKGDTTTSIYRRQIAELIKRLDNDKRQLKGVSNLKSILDTIIQRIGKAEPKLADFQSFQPQGEGQMRVTKTLITALSRKDDLKALIDQQLKPAFEHYQASG